MRFFLFESNVSTNLPFDIFLKYMQRKINDGVRFKRGYLDKEEIDVYYINDYAYGGYKEKLGLDTIPTMNVYTNKSMIINGELIINFRLAKYVLILYLLIICLLIFIYFYFIPVRNYLLIPIGILLIYLLALNNFSNQLFYFKHEIKLIEKEYKSEKEKKC